MTVAQLMSLLIARFRLKWKKVEKTTRQFSYGLNQITYDYTVEVTDYRDILSHHHWVLASHPG